MASVKTPTKRTSPARRSSVLSEDELAAMKETIGERKRSAKLSPEQERAQGEADLQAKIAGMPEPDRSMAVRVHAIVSEAVPDLVPRTYYGMPAWAKDDRVICFFKPKSKFKVRYATFEFQPDATLDEGSMWPVSFAVDKLGPAEEQRIAGLVKQAVG